MEYPKGGPLKYESVATVFYVGKTKTSYVSPYILVVYYFSFINVPVLKSTLSKYPFQLLTTDEYPLEAYAPVINP